VTHLADAGYETRGIATGGYLRPAYGFDLGFDVYETREPKDIDWSSALEFVRSRDSERPFFLFLHTYFVHAPYEYEPEDVDPSYDGPLRGVDVDRDTVFDPWHAGSMELSAADRQYVEDLYDGLVRSMDRTVSAFLVDLQDAVGDEPLMVVFTSDHGEAFLEHELYGHGLALWGEVLRVPLMVRYPELQPGVSTLPASGVDLLPTVLEAVGLPIPEGLPGRPLQAAEGASVRVAQYEAQLRSVMSDGYKLIEPYSGTGGPVHLFDMAADLAERRDLSQDEQARIEQLRQRLRWFLATYPEREAVTGSSAADSAALDELRALGYLGK
jgi:arylsulfatase A-like enzyme